MDDISNINKTNIENTHNDMPQMVNDHGLCNKTSHESTLNSTNATQQMKKSKQ